MAQRSDEELVARARRGDAGAFDQLVVRHQDRIYNVVLRILADRTAAEDVTQKVFLNAYLRLREFEAASRFSTWLYRIAHNESISHLRYERRRRGPSLDATPEEGEPGLREPEAPDNDPAAPLVQREAEELLRRALDRLDPEDRAVVVLREVEGMGYREIAAALGVPVGTVRSRLHRAREALRLLLRQIPGTDSRVERRIEGR